MRALRVRFPNAQIDFLVATEFSEAARLLPGITNIITFNRTEGWRGLFRLRRLLSRKYEIIVDLQNSSRSAFLRTFCFPLFWSKAVRYRFKRWMLIRFKKNLYRKVKPVPLRYLSAVDSFGALDDGGGLSLCVDFSTSPDIGRHTIVLCPGAKHFTKRWPIENWRALAQTLRQAGYDLTICCSGAEQPMCAPIAESGELLVDAPLENLAARMRDAKAVVCHDSGLMHLASGVGARVVAIFGPTVEPFGFFPFRADSVVLQQELSCRPCTAYGGERCPLGHHDCMRMTSVDSVFNAVQRTLSVGSTNA